MVLGIPKVPVDPKKSRGGPEDLKKSWEGPGDPTGRYWGPHRDVLGTLEGLSGGPFRDIQGILQGPREVRKSPKGFRISQVPQRVKRGSREPKGHGVVLRSWIEGGGTHSNVPGDLKGTPKGSGHLKRSRDSKDH